MFSTVSIMPGIDIFAPDRTATSSGFDGSPNSFPAARSTLARFVRTSSINPRGSFWPRSLYSLHVSVVIVKPGGTGRPMLVMSARFAPFPPSRSFISARPSPLPAPKKYTRLRVLLDPARALPLVPFRPARGAGLREERASRPLAFDLVFMFGNSDDSDRLNRLMRGNFAWKTQRFPAQAG